MVVFVSVLINVALLLIPPAVGFFAFRRFLMSRTANALIYACATVGAAVAALSVATKITDLGTASPSAALPAFACLLGWIFVRERFGWRPHFRYDRAVTPMFQHARR